MPLFYGDRVGAPPVLRRIDLPGGTDTRLGTLTGDPSSRPTFGLTIMNGRMLMVRGPLSIQNQQFFEVNPSTYALTLIATIDLPLGSSRILGMANDGETLWVNTLNNLFTICLLYTSPSPRD